MSQSVHLILGTASVILRVFAPHVKLMKIYSQLDCLLSNCMFFFCFFLLSCSVELHRVTVATISDYSAELCGICAGVEHQT